MKDRMQFSEDDPRHHSMRIREMMSQIVDHVREDVEKINDPKFQALFETTAEVLTGLDRAYEHAEQKAELAWK